MRIPSISSIVVLAAAMYGGYHAYQDFCSPYRILEEQGVYYLQEKETKQKLEIHDMQCGSLEHRLGGILKESKERLYQALESAKKRYSQEAP